MPQFQFDAAQARKLTDDAYTAQGEYLRAETEKCLKGIEEFAKKGQAFMTFYVTDNVLVQRLTDLGFGVKVVADPRDGDFLHITW